MAKMAMLDNIVVHSIRVCQVAMLLTEGINANGHSLNSEFVRAAALLHDITKTRSLQTSENHASTGGIYLKEQGYPAIGAIVAQHVNLDAFNPDGEPTVAEVVNYADKRVLHDQVVSLEARLAYIQERYKSSAGELGNRLERMCREADAIEKKLFKNLPFSTAELSDHLDLLDFEKKLERFRKINQRST